MGAIRRVSLFVASILLAAAVLAGGGGRAQAAYPGPDGLLAFLEGSQDFNCVNGISLRTIKPDGSGVRTLLSSIRNPVWSPDGTRLAFDTGGSIASVKADGSDYRSHGSGNHPTWSPDGLWFAYVAGSSSYGEIYKRPVAGGTATRLTIDDLNTPFATGALPGGGTWKASSAGDTTPAWSPSGNQIVFSRDVFIGFTTAAGYPYSGPQRLDLYSVNADGTGLKQITGDNTAAQDDGIDDLPSWSPSGAMIAFRHARSYPAGQQIGSVPAGGGATTDVTAFPYPQNDRTAYAAYSPTGRLAYSSGNPAGDPAAGVPTKDSLFVDGRVVYTASHHICGLDWGSADGSRVDAAFTSAPTAKAGEFQFSSSSTSTSGGALDEQWSFGDGTAGAGRTINHAYAKSGTYAVTLTATDQKGSKGTVTHSVTAKVTESGITVAVRPTVPPGGLGVGDTLAVPVTVTAGGTDLSAIALTALKVSGDAVKVSKQPAGTSGFALKAGASRSFLYEVKAAKPGSVTLSGSVTGRDPDSATVSDDDSTTFPVSSKAIRITLTAKPKKLTLEVDGKGKIKPEKLKLEVKVANTTKQKITGVSVISLNPVPADPTHRLDQLKFAKKDLPIKIGTLAGGASKTKTLQLEVTGDGSYEIDALALYDDKSQAGGNGRSTAHGGPFTAEVPLLFMDAEADGAGKDGLSKAKGGSPWFVTGHVKNLSSFQTICLSPLNPKWEGNSNGLGPHQIGVVGRDEPAPPLAGPLEPGKTISFLLRADTSADGGTRGSVTLNPRVTLGDPGDACNVLATDKAKAVAASKIKIVKGADRFSAHVDVTGPGPSGAGFLEFFGAYGKGSYKVLAEVCEGGLALAHQFASVPQLIASLRHVDPAKALQRAGAALASMARTTSIVANFWIYSTDAEKAELLAAVADDFSAKAGKVWDGTQAAIQQSARGWFDGVVRAYYAGDTSAMFKSLGGTAGEGLTRTAVEMAKWELGIALLKKTATLAGIAKRVGGSSVVIKRLKEMPVGKLLSLEEMQSLWGLSKADYAAFKLIAQEEGIVLGVRGRSVVSVKNLEEGAVWKHENLKPKNVNEIDTRFLGFEEADSGLVAFRTYDSKEKARIIRKIEKAGLSADERAAALDRANTRFGEKKYVQQIEKYAADGEIEVGFNYRDNGLDAATTDVRRKFALDAQKVKGGTYYRPLQENVGLGAGGALPSWCKQLLAKILCRVTGDMDGVYMTNVGGTSLSDAKRLKVYQRLAEAGWQHPETLTWMKNDGQFYFGSKKKILSGLELGGEPMIEFAPDGLQRATYFDLKKSFLFSKDSYYIDVLGGYGALL